MHNTPQNYKKSKTEGHVMGRKIEVAQEAPCDSERTEKAASGSVDDMLGRLFGEIEMLGQSTAQLESRLGIILSQSPEAEKCKDEAVPYTACSLALTLQQAQMDVRRTVDRLHSIHNRISL